MHTTFLKTHIMRLIDRLLQIFSKINNETLVINEFSTKNKYIQLKNKCFNEDTAIPFFLPDLEFIYFPLYSHWNKTGYQEAGKGKSSVTQLSFHFSVPLRRNGRINILPNTSSISSLCTKTLLSLHMLLNYVRYDSSTGQETESMKC